jgi:hypothetical protein
MYILLVNLNMVWQTTWEFNKQKLAMESRAYPIFSYNPTKGQKIEECLDLSGNPAIDQLWPTYKLKYTEYGMEKKPWKLR